MKQYIAKSSTNTWITGDWYKMVESCYDSCRAGNEPFIVECDEIKRIDAPWHLSKEKVLESQIKPDKPKRGRPKLGVSSKEVTLLPKHWQWLSIQQGGASASIRKLIDAAMKTSPKSDLILINQQKLDQFLYGSMGDQTGFEQASRAIYQLNKIEFLSAINSWNSLLKTFIIKKFEELEL